MKKVKQYKKDSVIQAIRNKLFNPLITGLLGYIIFLVVLISIKVIAFSVCLFPGRPVVPDDLIFCGSGFLLFFIIKFWEKHKYAGEC